jgi:PIN domain nuclease of toxin-antitoxin system
MERRKKSQVYLDTHIVVWLYGGLIEKFSDKAINILDSHDIMVSPIVKLELEYLYEIKRINVKVKDIIRYLQSKIGLQVSTCNFDETITFAQQCKWTRDPFDRIICAEAMKNEATLLTADKIIQQNYLQAII